MYIYILDIPSKGLGTPTSSCPKCFHIRACSSHLKLFIRLADEDAVC